jgi:diguanylate cyclase (GGDEF)-like protein
VSGNFEPDSLGLLQTIGYHVSVAFENALLYYTAITDELTGLYTSRHFKSSLDQEIEDCESSGEELALLLLDLDDFKLVNDTHGHVVGDSVLREVAQRVMASIRGNDRAFRYGGEEFAVLLPSTDPDGAALVAERVRSEIADKVVEADNAHVAVTATIGVSVFPRLAYNAADLVKSADQAMYEGKKAGKNCVVLHEAGPLPTMD